MGGPLAGIARVMELSPSDGNGGALEDIRGETLAEVGPLYFSETLWIALSLASTLADVHARAVTHGAVNPSHILVADGEAYLIDAGSARSVAVAGTDPPPSGISAEVLRYLSPEQTGRTGRRVDHRADLYGLGATLYELVTGRPPFDGEDALGIVHAHLAEVPRAPIELSPALSPAFSVIIQRLLEKDPDARYQSAVGLRHDLLRVVNGDTDRFPLGECDFPPRLAPPTRLVGRDREAATLADAFAEVSHDGSDAERPPTRSGRVVLISGAPGVGKTRLIDGLRPVVAAAGGWFVSGKFDQYRQDGDSNAIRQAVRGLVQLLMTESEAELARVATQLLAELGPAVGPLVAIIPELQALLEVQPEVPTGDPMAIQAQLQQAGVTVLRALATPERPIVMVIDDLQWAGPAPIAFIDLLVSGSALPGLLVVCVYREAEVDGAHPLAAAVAAWQRGGAAPVRLQLANLRRYELALLVADLLRCPLADATRLASEVEPYTGGNPFDTVELVNLLRQDGVLTLGEAGWAWDVAALRHCAGRGSVVDLIATRIAALPLPARQLVEVLGCLGGEVDLGLLALAAGQPGAETERFLAPAFEDGMLVRPPDSDSVCFVHDRVHQAVVDQFAPDSLSQTRLAIARRLVNTPSLAAVTAAQYLPVLDAIHTEGERRQAAEACRNAAEHARLLSNYSTANRFLQAVEHLVGRDVAVAADRHSILYCLGQLDDADQLYDWITRQSATPLDRVESTCTQMSSLTNRDRPQEALALGLGLLGQLGVRAPATTEYPAVLREGAERTYAWATHGTATDDLGRPEVTDCAVLAVGRLCDRLLPAAYFADHAVMAWLTFVCVRLWAEHGPAAFLVGPMSHLGVAMSELTGDYRIGYRAVRRVLEVAEARHYEPQASRARFLYALSVGHWFEPLEVSVAQARRAHADLVRGGDLQTAGYTYSVSAMQVADCAPQLDALATELDAASAFCARTTNRHALSSFDGYRDLLRRLRGHAGPSEGHAGEPVAVEDAPPAGSTAAAYCEIARTLAAAVMNDVPGLARHSAATSPLLAFVHGTNVTVTAHVMKALALVQTGGKVAEFDACHDWVAARAADAPGNFSHFRWLLDAERAAATQDIGRAASSYDAAIRAALERCRPWQVALITERSARFHHAQGWQHTADLLLREARRHYADWGAAAKVAQLEQEFPALSGLDGRPRAAQQTALPETIDLLGVLKCSQALSSETDLARLGARVTDVLGELTGATSVRVVIWDDTDQEWFLIPLATEERALTVAEAAAEGKLPLSAFRYAERSREPLIVEDVSRDNRFARDPYFAAVECRSLLLVPIFHRGTRQAMVVLGNSHSGGAFASDRLHALKLVTGQLAVSFDNALLYASLERKVAERTEELEQANFRLELLSTTDPLTGLANRRQLTEALEREWHRARRDGSPLAVAMIDIDHFKQYNDQYGHPAGDECLRRVAAALTAQARRNDLIVRYGGEEFAVVMPETDRNGAHRLAERAVAAIAALQIPHALADLGIVTVSIGIAAVMPTQTGSALHLVERADALLYQAKRNGRNRVEG